MTVTNGFPAARPCSLVGGQLLSASIDQGRAITFQGSRIPMMFWIPLVELDHTSMSTAEIRIIAAVLALVVLVIIVWRARVRRPPV